MGQHMDRIAHPSDKCVDSASLPMSFPELPSSLQMATYPPHTHSHTLTLSNMMALLPSSAMAAIKASSPMMSAPAEWYGPH